MEYYARGFTNPLMFLPITNSRVRVSVEQKNSPYIVFLQAYSPGQYALLDK
jgi:hypothetical protein